MKKLFLTLAILFTPFSTQAQMMSPVVNSHNRGGTAFAESFTRGRSSCGTGLAATCDQLWSKVAGSPTVTDGGPCAGGAQFTTSSQNLDTAGSFPTFDLTNNSNSVDIYASVCISAFASSQSLSSIIDLRNNPASPSSAAFIGISWASGLGPKLCGSNTNTSSNVCSGTLSSSAEHIIKMHVVGGASSGASYISIDGGTPLTFTATSATANKLRLLGRASTSFNVNWLRVDSSTGGFGPPTMFVDFASQSGTFSAAKLDAGSHCQNQNLATDSKGWAVTGSTMAFDSSVTKNLIKPVMVCGSLYQGNSGVTLKHDMSTTDVANYTLNTMATAASLSFQFKTNYLGTVDAINHDLASIAFVGNSNPFNILQIDGDGVTSTFILRSEYLNSSAASASVDFTQPISTDTWYGVVMYLDTAGLLSISLYDASGNLIETISATGRTGGLPNVVQIGATGADTTPAGSFFWYSNVKIDYARGSTGVPMQQ